MKQVYELDVYRLAEALAEGHGGYQLKTGQFRKCLQSSIYIQDSVDLLSSQKNWHNI